MKKIGCLGWGSLIWDTRDLPIRTPWFQDGPILPIEFARQSNDGRITLVIIDKDEAFEKQIAFVRSLWAIMSVDNIDTACKALAEREGIGNKASEQHIGRWERSSTIRDKYLCSDLIEEWAKRVDLDVVIWTALPAKFDNSEEIPPIDKLIKYLSDLPYEKQKHAETYIRKAPQQIDTNYRRQLETKFGWSPHKY